jgi:hypothetical protein
MEPPGGMPPSQMDSATGPLGVVHVPKSGGAAVGKALQGLPGCYSGPLYFDYAHFGYDTRPTVVPRRRGAVIASPEELGRALTGATLFIGHVSADTLLRAGCWQLAVQVREPRSRLLSLYRFLQAIPNAERWRWGRWGLGMGRGADRPLASFLENPKLWAAVDNSMARQLLATRSQRDIVSAGSLWTPEALEVRLAELRGRLRIVEWHRDSKRLVARVCEHLGVDEVPAVVEENVTRVVGKDQVVDERILHLLQLRTVGDSALLTGLSQAGLLPNRSQLELDEEFAETCDRLRFQLPRAWQSDPPIAGSRRHT